MSEMEENDRLSITYDTYWTFFMARDANLTNSLVLIRDFAVRKGLRSKVTMIIAVLTMVFVTSWPTIASAMTGYDSNNTGFINLTDSTQVPFSSFKPLLYVIHDGSRVGLSDDYPVTYCNGSCEHLCFFPGVCDSLTMKNLVLTYISDDGDPVAAYKRPTQYQNCYSDDDYPYGEIRLLERGLQFNVSNCESRLRSREYTLGVPGLTSFSSRRQRLRVLRLEQ